MSAVSGVLCADDLEANSALVSVLALIGDAAFATFIQSMQAAGRSLTRESVLEEVCMYGT